MPSYRYDQGIRLTDADLVERVAPFGAKFAWFFEKGYQPHYWQTLFHTLLDEETGQLCRYRFLVAGRRGGKTLSAAWEVLFYLLHPNMFHHDFHNRESEEALHVWVLTKDYPTGNAAWRTFQHVLRMTGMTHGHGYRMNKGDRYFEFDNGSLIEFKTADNPESLRGAGLDILWMDEAAFIPSDDAYNVVRPALSDKPGVILGTTTPSGKNWFYETFWAPEALKMSSMGRVEYRSIDNPYFPRMEWEEVKQTYHPIMFRQEFMASFDSMSGVELSGDWLHYYTSEDLPKDGLVKFVGVDPAISMSDRADNFAMALIGVTKEGEQAFLLKTFLGKLPFAEQLDIIQMWFHKYKPDIIGVESVAYQAALAQQAMRLPGLPPIAEMSARGKKEERIMSMAPLFRLARIRIHATHKDFIEQWLGYDSTLKNPRDDLLDAVEIAIRTAGIILPSMQTGPQYVYDRPAGDIQELALRDQPTHGRYKLAVGVDDNMGGEW